MGNIILRPCYNRAEMLKLSLEYEAKAREKHKLCDFTTLFLIEYGTTDKVKELVKAYAKDWPSKFIVRQKKFGLTINILEGFKAAFDMTDDFVLHLEDDILLHESYFQFMEEMLKLPDNDKYSVLAAFNPSNGDDVNRVSKHNHYAALAPIISKEFFNKYVRPCANKDYYSRPAQYVVALNNLYKKHWASKKYKYTDSTHYEQAGLIHRLTNVAIIEEDMYLYAPDIDRQQHIGFYGKNRPNGVIPGKSFEERLENLREIILSAEKMYQLTATKQYNDYKVFSPKLKDWNGTLELKGYKGTGTDE